ncbi:IS30 family transposase [Patescibacteria group bacterium]|nr:IS30 family transposase [Patescibacteria group bacterium]
MDDDTHSMPSRISLIERIKIEHYLKNGESFREISRQLGRSVSSISEEVRGIKGRDSYTAVLANKRSKKNSKSRNQKKYKIDKDEVLKEIIFSKLRKQWSPKQMSMYLRKNKALHMTVSPETIYAYLFVLPRGTLKKELLSCLRQNRKHRRKQKRNCQNPKKLEEMLSIHERPKEVEDRIIPGHWEGDLIVGKRNQSAIGTLVERTTRTLLLVPLKSRDTQHVAKAFARVMKRLPKEMKLTMTYDQGREMAKHKLITEMTGIKIYFADPRSPWQRGTNENTNGLIRQYFPKGTDFTTVTRYKLKKVQDLLNTRPRKTLDWLTPQEAFDTLINNGHCSVK